MTNEERKEFLSVFGKRVKALRLEAGMTLEEVAIQMGYTTENSRSSVQKIEAGKSDLPASKIYRLSTIFKVPIGYLMGWYDEFDQKHDTTKLQCEVKLIEQIEKEYGKQTMTAVQLFTKLDEVDRTKAIERMETLLDDEKYSTKEESSSGKAI